MNWYQSTRSDESVREEVKIVIVIVQNLIIIVVIVKIIKNLITQQKVIIIKYNNDALIIFGQYLQTFSLKIVYSPKKSLTSKKITEKIDINLFFHFWFHERNVLPRLRIERARASSKEKKKYIARFISKTVKFPNVCNTNLDMVSEILLSK